MHLGADWCSVYMDGDHENILIETSMVKGDTQLPDLDNYKVAIVQQGWGKVWMRRIQGMQDRGCKVLYEIDDYIHGIAKAKSHDFRDHYTKKVLGEFELCMRVADGLIVSTEYLARRYQKFNPNVFVCRNGIDCARYNLTRPRRPAVTIGWAGATGHGIELIKWLNGGVLEVLRKHENTRFIAIGAPEMARTIGEVIGEDRSVGTPFTLIENYPAAMTAMDIALAPAGDGAWYQGKSDLRWLEAGALGIPIIANPSIYTEIEDGVTGFFANTPEEMKGILTELVEDRNMANVVGANARKHIRENRDMSVMSQQWMEVAEAIV